MRSKIETGLNYVREILIRALQEVESLNAFEEHRCNHENRCEFCVKKDV